MTGAATIREWSRAVRTFNDDAPGDAIDVVDRAIIERLLADTGGDGIFSHGRKLGRATTLVTTKPGYASVEPSGSHGVWGILQGGTSRGVAARHTFTDGAATGIDAALSQLEADWGRF